MLPPELLQATIATHQKYITLSDADGKFSSHFIVLSNRLGDAERDKVIIAGNQRVLRARLADAEFFWQQDQARQLESYLPALGDVTFYEGLGSIHDKAIRMEKRGKRHCAAYAICQPKSRITRCPSCQG